MPVRSKLLVFCSALAAAMVVTPTARNGESWLLRPFFFVFPLIFLADEPSHAMQHGTAIALPQAASSYRRSLGNRSDTGAFQFFRRALSMSRLSRLSSARPSLSQLTRFFVWHERREHTHTKQRGRKKKEKKATHVTQPVVQVEPASLPGQSRLCSRRCSCAEAN